MADERIEDISGGELTAPAPGDLYVILDASDTTDDPQGTVKNIKHQTVAAGLSVGATKTASFTAAVGELYPISIASLGANIDVTFPSTPAAGDTFGFYVAVQNTTDTASSGFAQAPYWGVEPAATTDINNVSYSQAAGDGIGKWGLMLDGEILIFRWDAVTSTWMVIVDRRSDYKALVVVSTAETTNAAATWTRIGSTAGAYTVEVDNCGLWDATNDRIYVKRSRDVDILISANPNSNVTDTHYYSVRMFDGTTAWIFAGTTYSTTGTATVVGNQKTVSLLAGSYLEMQVRSQTANRGVAAFTDRNFIGIREA